MGLGATRNRAIPAVVPPLLLRYPSALCYYSWTGSGVSAPGQPTYWFKTRLNQNVNTFWGQKAGLSRRLSRGSGAQEPEERVGPVRLLVAEIWGSLGPLSGASGGAACCQGDRRPTGPTTAWGRCHGSKVGRVVTVSAPFLLP